MERLTHSQNMMVRALDHLVMVMEKNQISLKPEDVEDTDSAMLEEAESDNEEEMEVEENEDGGGDADSSDVEDIAEEEMGEKRKGKKRKLV